MRSGFPETNGQAEMAVDKFEQNGEGKEKKEKEDIMILDEENKQNSAAALRWVCCHSQVSVSRILWIFLFSWLNSLFRF